jgi:2-haloacid dehalogenase
MPLVLGFDVYGTLVDMLALRRLLAGLVGDLAVTFASLWRQKQVEYAFRHALMEQYVDFNACTREALDFTVRELGVDLSQRGHDRLMEAFESLPPYPDVLNGLGTLREQGHTLVAFSNGVEESLRAMLGRAEILPLLDEVVSVDALRTYKPAPAVYHYLVERLGRPVEETWLVSGNTWDVIGAKAVGLPAAWVKRRKDLVYDPWGGQPDLTVTDLTDLAARLAGVG